MTPPSSNHAHPSGIVTLLTDFGLGDWYVGAVKGAVLSIAPLATLVDITHTVPPQDVHHGAYVLGQAWRTFAPGTVHLAAVDPGVGTARRGLVVCAGGHLFVGPDNGLFTHVLWPRLVAQRPGVPFLAPLRMRLPRRCRAYVLDRPRYWRKRVSATFHARDVFGPVAAHLAAGASPDELGTATDEVTALYVPRAKRTGDALRGVVLHVDRFGNLVTSIAGETLGTRAVAVTLAGKTVQGLARTYGEAVGLSALIGSNGYLEIALPNGSAASELGAGVGEAVVVRRTT